MELSSIIRLAAAALLAPIALAGCQLGAPARPETAAMSADVRAGQTLAETHCARCHAIGRTGKSPHPAAPPFRTLSDAYPVSDLAEAFAEGILVGHPDMPEFTFGESDIDHLIAYLDSIQPPPAT